MIPEIGHVFATFRNNIPHRVIAWDDEGYAMIATGHGHLERASEVQGFTGLDNTQATRSDIVQLIPANGERIAYTNPDEPDPTTPVVAWGLSRDGVLIPLTVGSDGTVEQEDDDWKLAMTENGKDIRRSR